MKKKSGICFVFHILVKKFHGISTDFLSMIYQLVPCKEYDTKAFYTKHFILSLCKTQSGYIMYCDLFS